MKIIKCTQLDSTWMQAHVGCVTGSWMESVLDFTKKGDPGAKRKTYFRMKLAELVTGMLMQDSYVSKDMEIGIEREPLARAAYESEEGQLVEQIGFALHDSIPRFGGSVDGLIGDDGILEIKSPRAGTHLQSVLDSQIPEQYLSQIDTYLAVTGRAWCDFVSYCPEVPKPLRLMVIRRERKADAIAEIERAVLDFNAKIDAAVERLREIVGPFDLPAAEAEKAKTDPLDEYPDLELSDDDLDAVFGKQP